MRKAAGGDRANAQRETDLEDRAARAGGQAGRLYSRLRALPWRQQEAQGTGQLAQRRKGHESVRAKQTKGHLPRAN